MIKIILSGGLGNQMFQYAAGRALSLKLKTDLSVDLYKLSKKTNAISRSYELDVFDISIPQTNNLKNKFAVKSFKLLKNNGIGRLCLYLLNIFCDERAQEYKLAFEGLNDDATLFGYFQNENYFKEYSEQIRVDFSFNKTLDAQNQEVESGIGESNSVSMHIRRADYANANSNLPILDMSYYDRAIKYINREVENPVYYIFSDDMDWVKHNLKDKDIQMKFVDWNSESSSYIDMRLISKCKHNIIANSSFSWWGAWLNNNPNKLVIAPDIWYKSDILGGHPDGFIPEGWVIL